MKKAIATLTVLALLSVATPITASAHGHSSGTASKTYTLCAVENCNKAGSHKHSGTTYTGHYFGDGHDYHELCSVKNCTETGSHDHNGITCLPHNNADGHSYHATSHRSKGHH